MYIPYHDSLNALEDPTRLVAKGLWCHHEDALGRRHAYERSFFVDKDPTLRPAEIIAIFQQANHCGREKESDRFFRIEAQVDSTDWTGRGRILFHVEGASDTNVPRGVVIITAFRVRGWRFKGR